MLLFFFYDFNLILTDDHEKSFIYETSFTLSKYRYNLNEFDKNIFQYSVKNIFIETTLYSYISNFACVAARGHALVCLSDNLEIIRSRTTWEQQL